MKIVADTRLRFRSRGLVETAEGLATEGLDQFGDIIAQDARVNHPYRDRTGATTAAIRSERVGDEVHVKVRRGPGFWLELGFRHRGSGRRVQMPYIKPALDRNFPRLARIVESIGL